MKRDLRVIAATARKKALRRRNRERSRWMCCMLCEKNLPGRHGVSEQFRPTARAAALRDQLTNS